MLSYGDLGAKEKPDNGDNIVHFGVLLPGIGNTKYRLDVNWVMESFFYDEKKVQTREMKYDSGNKHSYWYADVNSIDFSQDKTTPIKYLYWYTIFDKSDNIIKNHIVDPYSREFGLGKLSAFTLNYKRHVWSDTENSWKTPKLKDIILYELHINEFGKDMEGCINRLLYLKDLGVNCIEIMPVHNVKDTVNWGYLPIGHFGIDERFGNRKDLQTLVDEAHKNGMAVILDAVFGHTGPDFTYIDLYNKLKMESPFNHFKNAWGGKLVDFTKPLPHEYYEAVIHNFYDNYHIDGFRFDCVSEYFEDYKRVVKVANDLVGSNKWTRFDDSSPILCAEYLTDQHPPEYVLEQTDSNCCCQNNTWEVSRRLAKASKENRLDDQMSNIFYLGDSNFKNHWYPNEKYPLLYISSHDHQRFICNFFDIEDGTNNRNLLFEDYNWTYEQRNKYWFKVQPYLIGLLMAKGIPFLWQGQELCENYYLNEDIDDISRVKLFRDVRWEYLFDEPGKTIHFLVKSLIAIRKKYHILFIDGEYYFFDNKNEYQSKKILLFKRHNAGSDAFVALNFGDITQRITMPSNLTGYVDLIENKQFEPGNVLEVNSNYGRIVTKMKE